MCSFIFHQHLFFVPFSATICLRPSQIYFNKSLYLSRKEQPLTSMVSHGFGLCPRPGFDFWNLILSLSPFFPGNKIFRLIWGLWTQKYCVLFAKLCYILVSSSPRFFSVVGLFSNNSEEFALGSSLLPSDWSLPHLPLSSHHDQFYTSPRWLTDVSGQELVILTDNESWIITAQSLASDLPGFTSWLCLLLAESLQPS